VPFEAKPRNELFSMHHNYSIIFLLKTQLFQKKGYFSGIITQGRPDSLLISSGA